MQTDSPPACRPELRRNFQKQKPIFCVLRAAEPPTVTTTSSSSALSSSHAVIDGEVLRTFTGCGRWPRCAASPEAGLKGTGIRGGGGGGKKRWWTMKILDSVKILESAVGGSSVESLHPPPAAVSQTFSFFFYLQLRTFLVIAQLITVTSHGQRQECHLK